LRHESKLTKGFDELKFILALLKQIIDISLTICPSEELLIRWLCFNHLIQHKKILKNKQDSFVWALTNVYGSILSSLKTLFWTELFDLFQLGLSN
jgi:hypothetical protein